MPVGNKFGSHLCCGAVARNGYPPVPKHESALGAAFETPLRPADRVSAIGMLSRCSDRSQRAPRMLRDACVDFMHAHSGCTTSQEPFESTLGGGHVSQLTQTASESARPAAENRASRKIVFILPSLQLRNPKHHLSRRLRTAGFAAPFCLRTPPSPLRLQRQAMFHRRMHLQV